MKRLLCIGHEAGRSGAPIVLLNLIKWIHLNKPATKIDLLLLSGGTLETEYRKYCDVHLLDNQKPNLVDRIANRLGLRNQKGPSPVFDRKYDVVIGNTIVTLPFLERFSRRDQKIVCWMHELEGVVSSIYPKDEFRRLAELPDALIVPSKTFYPMLKKYDIGTDAILAYDFNDIKEIDDIEKVDRTVLGYPSDAFIVVGAGTIESRKGTDLFIEIAERVSQVYEDVFFDWVGNLSRDENEASEMGKAMNRVSGNPRITVHPASPDYLKIVAAADVFALTSREDPCPLVALDAAALGKPIICFKDSGGIPEIIGDDAGKAVKHGSVEEFADAIIAFYNDRTQLASAAKTARARVETEFTMERSCRTIYNALVKVAGREQKP